MPQNESQKERVYTSDSEPTSYRLKRKLKEALGFGGQDINLPVDEDDSPEGKRKRGEDAVKRVQDMSASMLKGFNSLKRK